VANSILQEKINFQAIDNENLMYLQHIFAKTQQPAVMNLIVETMLQSYQFIQAKQFIASLDPLLLRELDPHLQLQVAFNSFSLSSNAVSTSLQSLVESLTKEKKLSQERETGISES